MLKIFVFLISISVNLVYSQQPLLPGIIAGSCLNYPENKDFNPTKYIGKWYEIERVDTSDELNLDCVVAEYTSFNETAIKVKNTGRNMYNNRIF